MDCPKCRTGNRPGAKYCAACGAALVSSCPVCQAVGVEGEKFCSQCGAPFAGPPDRPEATIPYTPRYLADGIITSRAAIEGERKQVTVLFCDIADSSALAHRIGAEAMHSLLTRFFDAALGHVHRYEGTLNQFLGDGFMALFGAPIAHEDHARRAALTALAIRRACHAAVAETETGRVPLRFGLNTGPVVVGKIGDNLRMDYTAIGDTTNLAARMQQLAAPGEILLAPHAWEAIHHHFDCEPLGEHRLRGSAQGVPVYGLRSARSGHPSHERAVAPSTPIVGRDSEISILRECVAQLRRGRGCIVGVLGEAGVGKSRLLKEVRRREAFGLQRLAGHALSFGQNLSYSPFMEALRGAAAIDEHEGRDASWRKLESFLRGLLAEQSPVMLPFAGMLMGLELPPVATALVARLDPQDVRGQIFIAARRIFEALARARPLVLELEDWHWADKSSAALLEHLLPLTAREALLVCFSGRADAGTACTHLREAVAQHYSQGYVEILLGPLSSSDGSRLIDNLLSFKHVAPALRGMILRKTEGNPLFIEEIVRSLPAAPEGAEDIELPDTIEAIITARIDRLEADVKHVLRLAAVIGRSFYRRILEALDKADQQLDQSLNELQHLDLIRQRRPVPELEYVFKHALVHETAYHSILQERRRELHRCVAEAIEALFGDRLDELAGLLAHHYARAGEWDKAQRFLLRAGDQASRMSADVEALAHYNSALESYARAFGGRWDKLERASLERKIGEAYFRLGQHEQASRHLHTALALLGNPHPRTRAGVWMHILGHVLRQISHQLRPRRRWHGGAQLVAADTDRVRAWVALGWLDYFSNEERFLLDVLAGLNWAERRGIGTVAAQGLTGLGFACDVMRLPRLAGRYHRRAANVAAQVQDPVANATAEFGMASHQRTIGELDSAVSGLERAMQMFGSQGKLREYGVTAATLAWILRHRGEIAKVQRVADEFVRRADDAGDVQCALQGAGHRAWILMQQGWLAQAVESWDRNIEGMKGVPDYQGLCEALGQRAICALWMDQLQHAEDAIGEGRRLMRERRIAPHVTTALREASAWLALTRLERAPTHERTAARRRAERAAGALHRLGRAYAGAQPIASFVEASVAWLRGRRGRAEVAWNRSLETASALGLRYQLAITRQQMGRLMRDLSQLNAALALFDEAGFAFQAARTLRYLAEAYGDDNPQAAATYFQRALVRHESMAASYERSLVQSGAAALPEK
jgi:class 3 adenylate cyclase/tetratricopeptide (TPR) repeat protein